MNVVFLAILVAFAIWGIIQGVLGRFIGVGRVYATSAESIGPARARILGFTSAAMAVVMAILILTGRFPTHH